MNLKYLQDRIDCNILIIQLFEKELEELKLGKSNEYIIKLREQAWYVKDVNYCKRILESYLGEI